MIVDFTVEEMSLVFSNQHEVPKGPKRERLSCILALYRLLGNSGTPIEVRETLMSTIEKLSMMTEQEYQSFDFEVEWG